MTRFGGGWSIGWLPGYKANGRHDMGKRINRYLTDSLFDEGRPTGKGYTAGAIRAAVRELDAAGVPDHAEVMRTELGSYGGGWMLEWEDRPEQEEEVLFYKTQGKCAFIEQGQVTVRGRHRFGLRPGEDCMDCGEKRNG